jgi:dTDP-4-amino-4,6-dideoxygalactose transaminase
MALRVAEVGPRDDVLVSDFTFVATVNPIVYQGARPVLVDANHATWNMAPNLVIEELERRSRAAEKMPKAVLVAHILGLPADVAPIHDACARYGVVLVEDAAEALGASYQSGPLAGRQVGSIGQLGCFSFNGNKIITTGGGGMIVTSDAAMARRARHLSTQARLPGPEYFHDEVGYNYRLTNLSAALGVAQLERLESFIARKRAIARRYDEALGGLPGITLPPRPAWAAPSMWLYSILVDPAVAGIDRRALHERLREKGIESRAVWAPAHLMPFYQDAPRLGGAVSETLFDRGLSLPCSVALTPAQQATVIEVLCEAVEKRS